MTRKTEVTFMVYRKNGTGTVQKRIFDLTTNEIIACTSSGRSKNNELMSWARNQFLDAKDVKIITAQEIKETPVIKKTPKSEPNNFHKTKKNSNGISLVSIITWILFFPFKLIWYILKRIWNESHV
ncbi:hypothetical protein [uncultured Flavobacterium sp.]|uniref:hypothetical protein n=1 Tax=uncultured Flavobacterium sp. TaxID=165435 RepID=UPI0025F0C4F3|nr:hypothetical protein [uncultured Flavobacterium sp.]